MKRTGSSKFSNPKRQMRRTQSVVLVRQPGTGNRQFGPTLSKETGYVDTSLTAACNTTGTITLLNTVASGTGVTQRVGKKIQLKGLQIRGIINSDSATTIAQYALMVVYDRRPAGALPAITEILDSISPVSFLNDANSARFKVLWRTDDRCISTNAQLLNETVAHVYNEYVKFSKKGKTNRTTYKAVGSGAIADIDEGALYFVTVGGVVAGTADCTGTITTRLRYWDV